MNYLLIFNSIRKIGKDNENNDTSTLIQKTLFQRIVDQNYQSLDITQGGGGIFDDNNWFNLAFIINKYDENLKTTTGRFFKRNKETLPRDDLFFTTNKDLVDLNKKKNLFYKSIIKTLFNIWWDTETIAELKNIIVKTGQKWKIKTYSSPSEWNSENSLLNKIPFKKTIL